MKKIFYSLLFIFSLLIIPLALVGCGNDPGVTLSNIEVKVASRQYDYKAFDTFDTEGLILRATYSNGSVVEIENGYKISYVSMLSGQESLHTDCFYAGEDKIKIEFGGKSCYLSIDEVEKINRELTIELSEYSQIATGNQIAIPEEYIVVKNSDGEVVNNQTVDLVYCSSFDNYLVNLKTTTNNGAVTLGGAPANVGTYKVFAKIDGGNNYNDVYSNVVELNLVDGSEINLCASQSEKFFAWREEKEDGSAILDPNYIQFKIETIDETKTIIYESTFAGNGIAMIFSDHITLASGLEKTQIQLNNNEILINNSEKSLKKWFVPSYLGTYEMVLTPENAAQHSVYINENKIITIRVYLDENKNDGVIYFDANFIYCQTEDIWYQETQTGIATYSSLNGNNSLAFNKVYGSTVEFLFKIENISEAEQLESFIITFVSELAVSSGEYVRVD